MGQFRIPFQPNNVKMSSFPQLDLIYFPVQARAECARMIMEYGGIPYNYTDCKNFFGMSFNEAKNCGKLPFGQLPVLQIGGKNGRLVAQSGSINRYLASLLPLSGFVPTNPVDKAYCDMIYEAGEEMFLIMPLVNLEPLPQKFQQEKENFLKNTLPPKLKNLAKLLGENLFFCGPTVTYCDFEIYVYFDLARLVVPEVLDDYPSVMQWMMRVENLPGVKTYL